MDHRLHLAVDGDQCVAEAVQFGERLAFGGLNHEGARYGPAHGRSVKSVVHQTLGGVLDFEAVSLPRTQVDDAFVGHKVLIAAVEHREKRLEAFGHVVGIEDGQTGGFGETGRAHHPDIHPRNDQDTGRPERSGRDGPEGGVSLLLAVTGEERDQLFRHRNGTDARTAATVRNAEGFVQIEVADVGADVARRSEPDLRVHIGAIHVDLAARIMDELANFAYC